MSPHHRGSRSTVSPPTGCGTSTPSVPSSSGKSRNAPNRSPVGGPLFSVFSPFDRGGRSTWPVVGTTRSTATFWSSVPSSSGKSLNLVRAAACGAPASASVPSSSGRSLNRLRRAGAGGVGSSVPSSSGRSLNVSSKGFSETQTDLQSPHHRGSRSTQPHSGSQANMVPYRLQSPHYRGSRSTTR
jgi:hypothetical protein